MGRKRTKSNIEYHNSGTEHPNAGKQKGGNGSKGRPRKKPRREVEERPIVLPEPEASSSEVPMITSTSLSRSASPAPSQIPQQDIEMSSSNVLDLENLPEVCSADRYRSLHTLWVETGSLPDLSSLPDPEPFNPVPYSPTESLLLISSSSSRSESVSSNNSSSSDSAPHRPRRKPFKAPPPPPEELRLEDLTLWNISSTDIANAAIYPISDESHFPCVLFAETPRSPLAARVEDVVDEDDRDTEIHVSWTEFLHEELGVDSDEEWKECGSESEYSSDDGSVDEDEILELYHEEGVDIAVLSEQLSHEFLPPLPVSMPPPPSSPSSDPPSESAPAADQADEEKPEWYRKWLPPPVEDASAAWKDLDTILRPKRLNGVGCMQPKINPFLWTRLEHILKPWVHENIFQLDGSITRAWMLTHLDFLGSLPRNRIVVIWFHDESTFYGNDRREIVWVHKDAKAIPRTKGEGISIMIADFVSADYGWLCLRDGTRSARVVFKAGKAREGYFTNENILKQVDTAMDILTSDYPDEEHIFVFDNATTHRKREDDALSARKMPKNPLKLDGPNFGISYNAVGANREVLYEEKMVKTRKKKNTTGGEGESGRGTASTTKSQPKKRGRRKKGVNPNTSEPSQEPQDGTPTTSGPEATLKRVPMKLWKPMQDTEFTDKDGNRVVQHLYFPDCHAEYPGRFKGMAVLLQERGLVAESGLNAECKGFKCTPGAERCCCRRVLYNQPDFVAVKSILETRCEARGFRVLFLPKFHCELNFIEQCWGAAKRTYRMCPPTKTEEAMEVNVLSALDSVELPTMRRFARRSWKFINAYRRGLNGEQAAWAAKKYSGHRRLPDAILEQFNEDSASK